LDTRNLFNLANEIISIKKTAEYSHKEIIFWREKYLDDMGISKDEEDSCTIRIRFMCMPVSLFDNDPMKTLEECKQRERECNNSCDI